ncbi:Pyruvate dehydrogenase E1 component [Symbiodinium microadriaticum]|uniref:Pyruvate dehydrogenase E1 component n=1 Tax=Symbiodinium microadriaticum TaxID=2951 RepID=A0A1Q9CSR8_SYMMI|nr:Pyruvate dehydrogenase E1 component [Symbiodinium microadriaticum]
MQQVLKAAEKLEEFGVATEIWSATNYGELHREAVRAERIARLSPHEAKPSCHVADCLGDWEGVTVIASDNVTAYPQLIEKYVGGELVILGTDGFGRSDTRTALRRFFEVDSESVTVAALSALSRPFLFVSFEAETFSALCYSPAASSVATGSWAMRSEEAMFQMGVFLVKVKNTFLQVVDPQELTSCDKTTSETCPVWWKPSEALASDRLPEGGQYTL